MSPPLRVLWLESGDLYTIRRGLDAARQRGIHLDALSILDVILATGADLPCLTTADSQSVPTQTFLDLSLSYDAVIVRSFMPFVSETLTIARLFQEAGKVVIDQSLTDEGYAMSKMHDYILLARGGVAVPSSYQCADFTRVEHFAESLGYPVILKAVFGSEGRNVFRVETRQQLRHTLWRRRPGEFLVQEYLDAEVDYRVMTVGYRALSVIVRRRPRPGEFRTNFEFKEEVTALPTHEYPAIRALAETASRTLRREFSGVDIRFRGDTPLVLEANRRPGFKGFEEATGYDVAGAFLDYVRDRCLARTETSLESSGGR